MGTAGGSDPCRVLYVAAPAVAETAAAELQRTAEGCSVEAATSVEAGAARCADGAVDCVVAKYDLPDGDGIELLRTLRQSDPDLPFVMYGKNRSEAVASRAISAGVTEYLHETADDARYDRLAEHVRRAVGDGQVGAAPADAASTATADASLGGDLERCETILTALGDPVYAIDADGCYTFVNEAFTSMTGYARAELLGEHTAMVVGEDAVEKGIELTRELLRAGVGATRTCEIDIVTADGARVPCENNVALLPLGEDGEFRGTAGVVRDISARKARERELEHQNERLEGFASVVSHDLRNPLNVAQTRLEFAADDPDAEHLDRAATALDRMEALIDDLLTVARQGQEVREREPVALATLADACWQTVATADATLVTDTTATVGADRGRLQQLLENLFRNAVEHGSTGNRPSADDAVEHGGDAVTVTVGDLDDGFYVADDGVGIPEDDRERVSEVGYSTSADGTGFGLSIVQRIAEAHGWTVTVTESDTGGARLEFTGLAGS
jgi:PAS domain S-box-containing protein